MAAGWSVVRSAVRLAGLFAIVAAVCAACGAPTDPPVLETSPVLRDERELRVVMIALDANADGAAFVDDTEEVSTAAMAAGTAHRVIIRDTLISDGLVESVAGEAVVELRLEGGYDLAAAGALAALRTEIAGLFPARREVLIITGHGRDWRGFGLRDGIDTAVISASELAAALSLSFDEEAPLVVLDTPWSASGELLTPFANGAATLVVASGARPPDGIDYRDTLSRLPLTAGLGGSGEELADYFAASMADNTHAPGVVLAPDALALVPAAINGLAVAGTTRASTAAEQEELQSDLIRESRCMAVPGVAVVGMGVIATLLDEAIDPALFSLSLYLTDVDRDGVPHGHRIDYRVDDAGSGLPPQFRALGWAPNHLAQSGFLYRLWYHQF